LSVRYTLSRSGGVAGLRKPPLVVDSSDLRDDQVAKLEGLLERSRFFDLPSDLEPRASVPDAFGYELSVLDDNGREHTVSFDMASAPQPLEELVSALRSFAQPGADRGRSGP
jgi:hypothetical protein